MDRAEPYEAFIVYFDILGYKAFFEDNENDIGEFLSDNLSVAEDTRNIAEQSDSKLRISYKLFSDNCIMVLRYDEMSYREAFGRLIGKIAFLQMKILKDYRIPIRGAITKGQIYLDEKIVFGSGLITVENLERTEAQFPRIILDESISNILNDIDTIFLKKDFDDKYYIDYFSVMKVGSIYTPKPDEKKTICKMRDSVHYLVERYGHYDNRFKDRSKIDETGKTILKYLWLLEKYNEFVRNRKLPVKISYQIGINPKLFKFELSSIEKNSWPVVAN